MKKRQRTRNSAIDQKPDKTTGIKLPQLEDRSYLAYLRLTPRPFMQLASGHFPSGTQTSPHNHDCLALHGCLQGPLILCTSEGDVPLDAGMFCLIAPGISHCWRNEGQYSAATMGLLLDTTKTGGWPAGTGIKDCCAALDEHVRGVRQFNTANDPELHNSFWLASDFLTAERPRETLALTGVLLTLFAQIKERICTTQAIPNSGQDEAQSIRRLLLARVRDNLSINQIACEIGISPTSAKDFFRSAFGCGIMSYFNQLKIWQAKRLLNDATLTVEQVSVQLGFASPSYFSRVFQKFAGVTPKEYRLRGKKSSTRPAS